MHDVFFDVCGKIPSDGPFSSLLVIGGPHQAAVFFNYLIALEHHDHNGSGGHKIGEAVKKGAVLVDGVKPFCLFLVHMKHFHGGNTHIVGLKPLDDFADQSALDAIRLYN